MDSERTPDADPWLRPAPQAAPHQRPPQLWVEQDPAIGNINPASGLPLDPVPHSSEQEVHWAVEHARNAHIIWCQLPLTDRIRKVKAFGDALLAEYDAFCQVIQEETGRGATDILTTEFSQLHTYVRTAATVAKEALRRSIAIVFGVAVVASAPIGPRGRLRV